MADISLSSVALPFIQAAFTDKDTETVKSGLRVAEAAARGCQASTMEALMAHVAFLESQLERQGMLTTCTKAAGGAIADYYKAEFERVSDLLTAANQANDELSAALETARQNEAAANEALRYYTEETESQRLRANDAERELAAQNEKVRQYMDANYTLNTSCAEKRAALKAANSRVAELERSLERNEERMVAAETEAGRQMRLKEGAEAEANRQMRLKEMARHDAERFGSRADELQEAFDNLSRAHAEDVATLRARNAEMFLELREARGYQDAPAAGGAAAEDVDRSDYDWALDQTFCEDESPAARGEEP